MTGDSAIINTLVAFYLYFQLVNLCVLHTCRGRPSVWTTGAALFQDALSPTGTSCFLAKLIDQQTSGLPRICRPYIRITQ